MVSHTFKDEYYDIQKLNKIQNFYETSINAFALSLVTVLFFPILNKICNKWRKIDHSILIKMSIELNEILKVQRPIEVPDSGFINNLL